MTAFRTLTPLICGMLAIPASAHEHDPARLVQANPNSGRHAFVQNQGQWEGPFAYKAEIGPLALFMEQGALTWSLLQPDFSEILHDASHDGTVPELAGHAWRVHFEQAREAAFVPDGQASYFNNYFLGNDPGKWRPNVPLHEEVTYAGLWNGIDLRMYLHEGSFKYDLVLAPNADVSRIGLRYEGVDGLRIDDGGRLVFNTSVGPIVEDRPVAWYGDDQGGAVDVRYTLRGNVLGFAFRNADAKRPIIIDPTLIASTLSGSTVTNYGHCATYDEENNIYTGAISFGQGYPTYVGSFQQAYGGGGTDIAVSKLTPDGTALLFATYVGGNNGEYPHSLIVDNDFNLWVYGSSNSPNYPVTPGAVQTTLGGGVDIVVTKVSPTGSELVGSTYLGGTANDGRNNLVGGGYEQYRGEIVVDAAGNAYVASCTSSNNFPVTSGAFQASNAGGQDGVVLCLDPMLTTLVFSTHIGGNQGDMAYGLKVREDGVIAVAGATASMDFPVTSGVHQETHMGGNDAFVALIAPDGSNLVASTYFGNTSSNVAYFLELDALNNIFIYGTSPGGIPIEPAGTYGIPGGGIFLAEFVPDLTSTVFTSSIGPGTVAPVAFLVDVCNNIYISGYQVSSGLPTTSDALYTSGGFYIAVFQPHMSGLLYGTYYIGASHVDGGTSRFDKNGVIYQGVCTSGGLPLTPGAFGTTQASWDIGVFKIDMEQSGVQLSVSSSNSFGCVPATITLTAAGNAPNYIWDPGDGSPLVTGNPLTHTYTMAGTYTVMVIGWDSTSCNTSDTAYVTLPIYDPVQLVATFTAVPASSCNGYGVQLTNTSNAGSSVLWNYGDGTSSPQVDPYHPYQQPGTYEVTLTVMGQFCEQSGSTTQLVTIPPATIELDLASPVVICDGGFVQLSAGTGFDSYIWSDGQTAAIIDVFEPGDYSVIVTEGFCVGTDTITVVLAPEQEAMADRTTCPGIPALLSPTFPVTSIIWNTGSEQVSISVAAEGLYWFTAIDELGCTRQDTAEVFFLPATDTDGFIPNVFSPNGDGVNDRFQVDGFGLVDFRMVIHNRWGQVVYETSNVLNGWNGGLNNSGGDQVPDGTYYYIITYSDLCSEEDVTIKKGHVTLLR